MLNLYLTNLFLLICTADGICYHKELRDTYACKPIIYYMLVYFREITLLKILTAPQITPTASVHLL